MKAEVRAAYLAVRGEVSTDAVVADPALNSRFLAECQRLGLAVPAVDLNLCLLNLRKSGDLQGIKSVPTRVARQDEFRHAAEAAARLLERRYDRALDRILCDPSLVVEFDRQVALIAPGFRSFDYRWSALNLRKRRSLRPELLGRVVPAERVEALPVVDLAAAALPARAGLYVFYESRQVLYIGECQNLRKRVGKHLDHSDNKGLARWLWDNGAEDLHLEYHVLPVGVTARVRKALEAELILSRRPIYNVAGVEPRRKRG